MKKMFYTLFIVTFVSFSSSLQSMEEQVGIIRIPKQINNDERSPLHRASCKGDIEAVISLLDEGMSVNQTDHTGATPLHFAAWYGHTEIVQLLCNRGADVNLIEIHGYTPLKIAEFWKHFEIVELLIKAGACANKTNDNKELVSLWDRILSL